MPVSGTVDLTTDATDATSVQYLVDGKEISGTKLDTASLSDGQHTITVIKKTADGNTTQATQQIDVQNGWQHKIVAGAKQYWPVTLGLLVVAILLLVGGVFWWRKRGDKYAVGMSPYDSLAAQATLPDDQLLRRE
jgi:hypothetical protein